MPAVLKKGRQRVKRAWKSTYHATAVLFTVFCNRPRSPVLDKQKRPARRWSLGYFWVVSTGPVLYFIRVTPLCLNVTGKMNGFAALDIHPHRRYVVDKAADGQAAAAPYKFCSILSSNGLYTEFESDPDQATASSI